MTTETLKQPTRSIHFGDVELLAQVDSAANALHRDRSTFVRDSVIFYLRHLRMTGEIAPAQPSQKAS